MPASAPFAASDEQRRSEGLLDRLSAPRHREGRLLHVVERPARPATYAAWPDWAPPPLVAAWRACGVEQPWQHQAVAAEAVWTGRHVALATGTASGKSLAFGLPGLSLILASRRERGERGGSVLYLSPTKALAHDQLRSLTSLLDAGGLDVRCATHDGDSSREEREWARDHVEYLLTNPDMLHRSMLPGHRRWARFWRSLRLVVVDESHHYRGVFGAHVALVLRRLRRVAALYDADPTFVLASATTAEPGRSARQLTGLDALEVAHDTSPRGAMSLGFWEPPLTDHVGEHGAPLRRAATSEVADLLADLVVDRVRTLAFVRSRRGAETVAMTARALVEEVDPALGGGIASYRGGYLPEDRRALEAQLRDGELWGLATTTALELGIDVAGLDAVLLAGFPGTRAAFWQQVGRAGRRGRHAIAVLVARDDPLDSYVVRHPDVVVDRPVEASVFDPGNPYVLGPHLCAAADEAPLAPDDLPLFGDGARGAVDALTQAGLLRRRAGGWFWTDRTRAADLADIRSTAGPPVALVDATTGRVVGSVDRGASHGTAHAGAVYLHQGETWLVERLDLDAGVATLLRRDVDHTTWAREVTAIDVVAERRHQLWGACRLSVGSVRVTSQVVSFLRRAVPGGDVLGEEPLDLPPRILETTAVWWSIPAETLAAASLAEADLPGAAHAAEHASIGLLPLFATCDRWDLGGVSTALHPDTGRLTVFVHDAHPGGAGFAERGFSVARRWLSATRETIASCPCADGCPACVQSPKCGNGNAPLDKRAAVRLLDVLLAAATDPDLDAGPDKTVLPDA